MVPLLFVSCLCAADIAAAADVPSNGWVVWASDRESGRHEIYVMKADGTGVMRLTQKGGEFPGWSPDGKWVAYTYTPDRSTHVMRHNGSGDKKVCDGSFRFWMWDGSGLVCGISDSYYVVNPDTGASKLLFKKSDFSQVSSKILNPGGITRDGRYLVGHTDLFRTGFTATNGTFKAYHAAAIFDFTDKSKVYFFGDGCEPTTPPTGSLVYHVCGGGACGTTHPAPYKMDTGDKATRSSYAPEIAHVDADWGHEYFPRISNDNTWMAYGATTGCHDHDTCDYEIFLHRLGGGNDNRTRITTNSANDQWPHVFVGTLLTFGCTGPADCDDNKVCTTDTCSNGTCTNAPISGCCVNDSECGDSDPCTADSCVSNVCKIVVVSGCCSSDAQCQDSNTCTSDACVSNKCAFTPISGCCAKDADCADANACTMDSCDVATGTCSNAKVADCCAVDTDCDDDDACSIDTCTASVCEYQDKTGCCTADSQCDDSDSCTADSCNLTTNACDHQPNGSCELSLPLKINCGSNEHDVSGWLRDDIFVTGGGDWVNSNVVDVAGVSDAAPTEVYRSVRHKSPHSYSIPVANGTYTLTFHFADAYDDRKMNYEVEGKPLLADFDIVSAAGGVNKAYVVSFEVVVADGDGMQIEATSDGDVFEAGLEISLVSAPEPDAGPAVDAGPARDGGLPSDGGSSDARAGDAASDQGENYQEEMVGGCAVVGEACSPVWPALLLFGWRVVRRRRAS